MEDSLSAVEEIMRKLLPCLLTRAKMYQLLHQMRLKEKLLLFQAIQVKMFLLLPEEAVRQAPLAPSHPSQEGPSTPSAEGVSRRSIDQLQTC